MQVKLVNIVTRALTTEAAVMLLTWWSAQTPVLTPMGIRKYLSHSALILLAAELPNIFSA